MSKEKQMEEAVKYYTSAAEKGNAAAQCNLGRVLFEEKKVKNSLEELGLHCEDMHVLGVFEADSFREK